MNLNISQDNVHLLIPAKISRMAVMMIEDTGCSVVYAIDAIYKSEVYRKLADESTKYWHLGPVDLYNDFKREYDRSH